MTIPDGEVEANRIEMAAAERSYKIGFGVSEWESFLTPEEIDRLIELGDMGFGTWGNEHEMLMYFKNLRASARENGSAKQ